MKNMRLMNEALLLKHLHKFNNNEIIPWVQLIWNTHYANGQVQHARVEKGSSWFRDIMKFSDHFRGIAAAKIGQGNTVMRWADVWNDNYLMNTLPRLYSFAKNKNISVAQQINNTSVHEHFHLPLSQKEFEELQSLNQIIYDLQQQEQCGDSWSYISGTSTYT